MLLRTTPDPDMNRSVGKDQWWPVLLKRFLRPFQFPKKDQFVTVAQYWHKYPEFRNDVLKVVREYAHAAYQSK